VKAESKPDIRAMLPPFVISKENTMTTIETLFGTETVTQKPRSIRFKTIKAVWDTLKVEEPVSNYLKPLARFSSSEEVYNSFKFLSQETKEHFIALHLDSKNRVICVDLCSTGSLTASITHPRDIFKSALLSSAAAMLFIHNHPSQDPTPSREDMEITTRLKECGELLGIRILDHLIIAEDSYISFVDRGLL
jgi:DNA repair protein RadC